MFEKLPFIFVELWSLWKAPFLPITLQWTCLHFY